MKDKRGERRHHVFTLTNRSAAGSVDDAIANQRLEKLAVNTETVADLEAGYLTL
jgi:hypothetical protein